MSGSPTPESTGLGSGAVAEAGAGDCRAPGAADDRGGREEHRRRRVHAPALAGGAGVSRGVPHGAAAGRRGRDSGPLQEAAAEAVVTLRRNLSEPTPQAVQVRAAVAILEHAARGVELLDLAERVAALEEGARQEHEP